MTFIGARLKLQMHLSCFYSSELVYDHVIKFSFFGFFSSYEALPKHNKLGTRFHKCVLA